MSPSPPLLTDPCDTLIIGGSMAGLSAAIHAPGGQKVILLEKNAVCGRKILVTGGGQCNCSHRGTAEELARHYGGKERFVLPALYAFGPDTMVRSLAAAGVAMETRSDGKIFPRSKQSRRVRDALVALARGRGVRMVTSAPVLSCRLGDDGGFLVSTCDLVYRSKRLILAVGGKAFPQSGSTGDGFLWARDFGHTLVEPTPALTAVEADPFPYASCAGISLFSPVIEHKRGTEKIGTYSGEVLWTHRGLSGPAILDASRNILPGDRLLLSLTEEGTAEKTEEKLLALCRKSPGRRLSALVATLGVPQRLAACMFQTHVLRDPAASDLTRAERRRLIELLVRFPFTVRRLAGWHKAMTTAGGVDLREVNRKTMQSRLIPGLFFAGELLDVDGDCGGYNLQWAWSSGALAAESAAP